jgi:uncharacterized membrane protein HdeD (DUF308 family)
MSTNTPSEIVRQASTWSILWGVSLIVLGMLAVGSPLIAAVAFNAFIAWLIVFAGVVHLIIAFHTHRAASLIWKLLVGLAYVFFGGYLLARPLLGVASLTLVLASLFLIEGVFELALFFRQRSTHGSSWLLLDGIVTLILGVLIYMQWPTSAAWAIGTLVGVSMIISGFTRVMVSFAMRKATSAAPSSPSSLAA